MSDIINDIIVGIGDLGQLSYVLARFVNDMPGFVVLSIGICVTAFWVGALIKFLRE